MTKQVVMTVVDKSDGHGTQFELKLDGAAQGLKGLIESVQHEAATGGALYVDSFRVEGDSIVISFCRGSVSLAKLDHMWNHRRTDEKFWVIVREEIDEEGRPTWPKHD